MSKFGFGFEMRKNTTVIIPTLNEAATVKDVILGVKRYVDHVLVIDGNSADSTTEIAKSLGAEIVLQKGIGKGVALRQAFSSKNIKEVVIFLDGDGSMLPSEIPLFFKAIKSGAHVVKGSRFLGTGYSTDLTLSRRIGNLMLVLLVNLLWRTQYTDLCYGFGAVSKNALEKILPSLTSKSFEIETEFFIKARKFGFVVAEVPSIELRRKAGISNLHAVFDGYKILRTILREYFRT